MNIGIFALLIFILLLSIWALVRQYRYQKLVQTTNDPNLKERIKAYRIFLHEKQIFLLLVINILLVFGLTVSIVSIFQLENASSQLQKLTQTYYQSHEEKIRNLEKQVKNSKAGETSHSENKAASTEKTKASK